MTERSPLITLNNGVQMPALGLGMYLSPPDQTAGAVESAIASGYRLIDTAAAYGNEHQVGDGIRRSEIDRSEIFLITKLWISDYGYDQALRAFDASMGRLGLEYLDLYLLHWPVPSMFEATTAAYRAAERLLAEKRVRAIGVCNFKPEHLENLCDKTQVVPAVNQVELHPLFNQRAVREANARHGIVTQSWSPIGGVFTNHPKDAKAVTHLLAHSALINLATKYQKSPAQVVLRWHVQHGLSVIPKSVRPNRIAENMNIFDFELTGADIAAIDALDAGARGGPDPDTFDLAFLEARVKELGAPS
jgi:diketogulonate reductase-like aldo/keto reductase